MVGLRTRRLTLRDYEPDGERAVLRFAADPEVVRFRIANAKAVDQVREFRRPANIEADRHPRTSWTMGSTPTSTGDGFRKAAKLVANKGIATSDLPRRNAANGCLGLPRRLTTKLSGAAG